MIQAPIFFSAVSWGVLALSQAVSAWAGTQPEGQIPTHPTRKSTENLALHSAEHPLIHPIDEKLEGPESIYTNLILKFVRSWPPAWLQSGSKSAFRSDSNPVQLQCIETPGSPYYIGLQQQMTIDAPLSRVEAILDDIDHYQQLFPGYDDIHILSRNGNKFITSWEQHIPLFFLPNIEYQVIYLVDKSSDYRRMYRYKLKESSHLNVNDGLIVLETDPESKSTAPKTRYTEFDFFDADWGILKTLAPGRIWKDSVEGIYLSDVAIKLRAEHPDWDYKQLREKSRKILESFPVERAIETKRKLSTQEVGGSSTL